MYNISHTTNKPFPKFAPKEFTEDLQITIYSRLLDASTPGVRLYLVLRTQDKQGEGTIICSLKNLAKVFKVNRSTIHRWLSNNILFRIIHKLSGDLVLVRYNAIAKVCGTLEISNLGACTSVPLNQLRNFYTSRLIATQAEMQQCQERAHTVTKKRIGRKNNSKKGKRIRKRGVVYPGIAFGIPESEQLGLSSEKMPGLSSCSFSYFQVHQDQSCPGASQQSIAENLKRSRPTISRRLSNKTRLARGLPYLPRKRVVRFYDAGSTYLEYLKDSPDTVQIIPNTRSMSSQETIPVRFLSLEGDIHPRLYELCTNIYAPVLKLLRVKKLQVRINRFVRGEYLRDVVSALLLRLEPTIFQKCSDLLYKTVFGDKNKRGGGALI